MKEDKSQSKTTGKGGGRGRIEDQETLMASGPFTTTAPGNTMATPGITQLKLDWFTVIGLYTNELSHLKSFGQIKSQILGFGIRNPLSKLVFYS